VAVKNDHKYVPVRRYSNSRQGVGWQRKSLSRPNPALRPLGLCRKGKFHHAQSPSRCSGSREHDYLSYTAIVKFRTFGIPRSNSPRGPVGPERQGQEPQDEAGDRDRLKKTSVLGRFNFPGLSTSTRPFSTLCDGNCVSPRLQIPRQRRPTTCGCQCL
jgi:hypothetical protein